MLLVPSFLSRYTPIMRQPKIAITMAKPRLAAYPIWNITFFLSASPIAGPPIAYWLCEVNRPNHDLQPEPRIDLEPAFDRHTENIRDPGLFRNIGERLFYFLSGGSYERKPDVILMVPQIIVRDTPV